MNTIHSEGISGAKTIETAEQYIDSLRGRELKVFLFGEVVKEPVDHPMIRPRFNMMAETYELAVC
jgi:4-hydroxybutyryl-CoA dehydratase/vinylacetyl-CoA-Delta-isomerase